MFSSVGLNQASLEVCDRNCEHKESRWKERNTDLLEDVMKESVVAVVVHAPEY